MPPKRREEVKALSDMVESCKIASNQKVNESRQKMPDCTEAAYYTGKRSGCSAVV
ncbi:hypothetical protein NEIPOLOT_00944 [Neisseria polysaccharea ATCC 43768]|nr:hypothetical protein NEIPOLOT_00944 [Neisseria polysaccharea ATCC 43768]CBA06766.1 hypothetical protein predicted by Glimmer/Critica [Neisseria meningitidis alpha153]